MGAGVPGPVTGPAVGRPGPDRNEAHRTSYAAWQRKLGFSGKDADGVPGRVSRERLLVPNS